MRTKSFKVFFLCFLMGLIFHSCGCSMRREARIRLGVDSNWHPLDFGAQTAYVNGFIEELLIDIST